MGVYETQGLQSNLDEKAVYDGMATVPRHVHFELFVIVSLMTLNFVVLI